MALALSFVVPCLAIAMRMIRRARATPLLPHATLCVGFSCRVGTNLVYFVCPALELVMKQAFPPTASASKPGMVMGMVLASVPTLGKVLGEERGCRVQGRGEERKLSNVNVNSSISKCQTRDLRYAYAGCPIPTSRLG